LRHGGLPGGARSAIRLVIACTAGINALDPTPGNQVGNGQVRGGQISWLPPGGFHDRQRAVPRLPADNFS
jgi:hypothetical protein